MKFKKIVKIILNSQNVSDRAKLIQEILDAEENKTDPEEIQPEAAAEHAEQEKEADKEDAQEENIMDADEKKLIDQVFSDKDKDPKAVKESGARKRRAWQMRAEGKSVEDIARAMNVTTRAVYVWLKDAPEKYKTAYNARMTAPEAAQVE